MSVILDQRRLRDVFGVFPSGVVTVAALVDGELGHVLTVRVAHYSDERPIALATVRAAPAGAGPATTEPGMN